MLPGQDIEPVEVRRHQDKRGEGGLLLESDRGSAHVGRNGLPSPAAVVPVGVTHITEHPSKRLGLPDFVRTPCPGPSCTCAPVNGESRLRYPGAYPVGQALRKIGAGRSGFVERRFRHGSCQFGYLELIPVGRSLASAFALPCVPFWNGSLPLSELMSLDPLLAIAAFGIGIVVGLTGMGGGALMTPVLVLFFNVPPLSAVSSDLVASAVMKPVGSIIHLRRGTVHLGLVKWLCIGSIPGAFSGVVIARALGRGQQVQDVIRIALGVALLLAAAGLTVRAYIRLVERARHRDGRAAPLPQGRPSVLLRPLPTMVVGLAGRYRRGTDVGGLGIADHHRADGAVPDPQGQRAGGHRPGAGRTARRLGGARAISSSATSSST